MSLGEFGAVRRRLIRRFAIIVIIAVIIVVGAIVLTRAHLYAAPEQPIVYSHRTHVEAGIQCLYCHAQAQRSAIAGIPSVQRCMGCHQVIATENVDVKELTGYWERGEPIPWARVNIQPDFVYFSHQPHLSAGLNCETCHGNVGAMDKTRPTRQMDMGWCLTCHTEVEPEHVEHLADCVTCHK